ncbi:MAG: D-proline reductase (dithiol) PrdB [Limisphaerales bacterium]|jgi:D-proline reductase (dithiol) PrdB
MTDNPHRSDPIDYIQRTHDQYAGLGFPPYEWVHSEAPPDFSPLNKSLSDCKLGLVCSGGIYAVGQVAFHFKDDFSYREIATNIPTEDLRATHFAYDLTDARIDPNVVFPIDTLRTMVTNDELGSLADNAYTFMGGIYSARKVADILAPAIADRLVADEVDVALMVPV